MEQPDITYFCKTKAQALDFTARLTGMMGQIYENNFNLELSLSENFGMQKKDMFIKIFRENNINTEKIGEVKSFLTTMQETISKLPVLDMIIAIEPNEKTLQTIADWYTMTTKKQILLNITTDPLLIAGAKINFKGRYLDASLKPTFDKILQETEQSAPLPAVNR